MNNARSEVPQGYVLLQRHDGKPLYAACLDGGRFNGWLMSKHPDGQWVSQRKLESWEVMQAEDQRDYDIVHETAATKPTADLSGLKRFGMHMTGDGNFFGAMPDGPYVELADVQSLLATKPAAAPAGRILASVTKEMRAAGLAEANRRDCDADSSDVEMIFNAMLDAAPAASTIGAAQTAEQVRDAARFQWIEENCRTEGGGHGFTIFVPVDHEDIGCGIDEAMARPTTTQNSEAAE